VARQKRHWLSLKATTIWSRIPTATLHDHQATAYNFLQAFQGGVRQKALYHTAHLHGSVRNFMTFVLDMVNLLIIDV
jgi:hypothetical protein